MDFRAADWIALVSVLSAGAIAGATILARAKDSNASREHERRLAEEERLQRRREEVYIEILSALERSQLIVERTRPILQRGEFEPLRQITDEEAIVLQAKLHAFGSDEVRELLDVWTAAVREFNVQVEVLGAMENDRRPDKWVETWGKGLAEQHESKDQARKGARDAQARIVGRIRRELGTTSLPPLDRVA